MRPAQRALLQVVGAHDGVTDEELYRLLASYCQRRESPAYEFVRLGERAVSFTAAADLEKLIQRGLVERASGRLRLSPGGVAEAGDIAVVRGTPQSVGHGSDRGAAAPEAPQLYTIGYEGRSLENYLNRLLGARASTLCDVRRNPLSRKFGFSKSTLARACLEVGIRYEHFPELGIASERRRNVVTAADREALFEEYARETIPHAEAALDRIGALLESGTRLAVTCFEAEPAECHRSRLAEALSARFAAARPAEHL